MARTSRLYDDETAGYIRPLMYRDHLDTSAIVERVIDYFPVQITGAHAGKAERHRRAGIARIPKTLFDAHRREINRRLERLLNGQLELELRRTLPADDLDRLDQLMKTRREEVFVFPGVRILYWPHWCQPYCYRWQRQAVELEAEEQTHEHRRDVARHRQNEVREFRLLSKAAVIRWPIILARSSCRTSSRPW
jgi:hypothetical protein